MEKIRVSEMFDSLQGEGMSSGAPCRFIRLTGCNLLCNFCDTIPVWQKGEWIDIDKFPVPPKRVVITGGEPLLQQKAVVRLIQHWNDNGDFPYIEVETNGTIMPSQDMLDLVGQWNCSPKTSNSGELPGKRIDTLVLQTLADHKAQFKFVIGQRKDVLEFIQEYGWLPDEKVWFMPMASKISELKRKEPMVAQEAMNLGVNYSSRLQVQIWNEVTGV